MSKLLLGHMVSEKNANQFTTRPRCVRRGLYLENTSFWEDSQKGPVFLGELQRIDRARTQTGYIAFLKNENGNEDFATFSTLGGDLGAFQDFSLLIKALDTHPCSFLLKNVDEIYISKKGQLPEFIGTFVSLERTATGNILLVQKEGEEFFYDCETGHLIFTPIKGEKHWVNSTGCIARNFLWPNSGGRIAEVYTRDRSGNYQCTGRIPVR